jgi:hypothetical protein
VAAGLFRSVLLFVIPKPDAAAVEKWLGEVVESFGQRILRVDTSVAETWGRLSAGGNFLWLTR